jgi:sporulation peptidase YabG
MDLYQKFGIPVNGIYCNEKEMPQRIGGLLDHYRPDILVVTGHDAYSKSKGPMSDINAYRHSKDFVQTVREARRKVSHLDQLIIFAGACQSHFESLIQAGANFASSPSRVNIHALDPVYIVGKISFTPFSEHIHVWDVPEYINRREGLEVRQRSAGQVASSHFRKNERLHFEKYGTHRVRIRILSKCRVFVSVTLVRFNYENSA